MEGMGNTLSIILSVIGALGGFEAIKWAVSTWINRKTNARKEDAAADSMEIDNEKKQIDNITIGSILNQNLYTCKCKIYDVLLYDRILTEEEIQHNYKASQQFNGMTL